MTMWVCRAGSSGEHENFILNEGTIRVGFIEAGDVSKAKSFEEMKKIMSEKYPDYSVNTTSNFAGQMDRFANRMKIGDIVLVPSKIFPNKARICEITGRYIYDTSYYNAPNKRSVGWKKDLLDLQLLDSDIRHSLNSALTVFGVSSENEKRIKEVLKKGVTAVSKEIDDEDLDIDVEETAVDEIRERIYRKYKGYGMEKIVGSILKAKGFTVYQHGVGKDGGVDLLASDGIMGFGTQRICVQVKTEDSPIGRKTVDELQGVMSKYGANYGLFVSWSGFKIDEADLRQIFFNIRMWDHNDIVREFLENYDNLDDEIKNNIPLKKIWVVAEK